MKLWVVYLWEPYEIPCYHRFFLEDGNAKNYFDDVFDASHNINKHWKIAEIETED